MKTPCLYGRIIKYNVSVYYYVHEGTYGSYIIHFPVGTQNNNNIFFDSCYTLQRNKCNAVPEPSHPYCISFTSIYYRTRTELTGAACTGPVFLRRGCVLSADVHHHLRAIRVHSGFLSASSPGLNQYDRDVLRV